MVRSTSDFAQRESLIWWLFFVTSMSPRGDDKFVSKYTECGIESSRHLLRTAFGAVQVSIPKGAPRPLSRGINLEA